MQSLQIFMILSSVSESFVSVIVGAKKSFPFLFTLFLRFFFVGPTSALFFHTGCHLSL
jgi:hypothetical protein